jgi:hypothetical protein
MIEAVRAYASQHLEHRDLLAVQTGAGDAPPPSHVRASIPVDESSQDRGRGRIRVNR